MRTAQRKGGRHGGDSPSPVNGDSNRVLRLMLAGTPGGLTNLVQVFSSLLIPLDRLEYTRDSTNADLASVVICYRADDRTVDLILRKLSRLMDVLSVIDEPAVPDIVR